MDGNNPALLAYYQLTDSSPLPVAAFQGLNREPRTVRLSIADYFAEAAAIMADNKIGALPVVDQDDRLVGILSATGILRVFSKIDKASDEKENKAQPGNKKATHSA